MKFFVSLICAVMVLSTSSLSLAQSQQRSVVIGDMTSKPNAILVLNPVGDNQGFLLPQLTTTSRLSITPSSPSEDGLLVFDITEKEFYAWKNGGWVKGFGGLSSITYDPVTHKLTLSNGNIIDLSPLKEVPVQSGNNGKYLTTDGTQLSWASLGTLGDITSVNVGKGLSGGGASGDVTMSVKTDGSTVGFNGSDQLQLNDNSVTTNKIVDGTVTTADLADNSVTGSKFADNSITTLKLANDAVTTAKIANNAVTTTEILDGTIITADLADNSVTGSKFADNSITNLKLANGAVTTAKIVSDAITTTQILDSTIGTADLADNSVTGSKFADNSITTLKLANNSVTSAKILDANVTDTKLANNAVTTLKIADDAITTQKIANNAVTTAEILDGTIATQDLANASVTATKLANTAVTAGTYGDDSNIPQITIDAQGRITSATVVAASSAGGPTAQYYSIDPSDFYGLGTGPGPDDDNDVIFEDNTTFITIQKKADETTLMAPIHLPDGAVVQQITLYYMDRDAQNLSVDFYRKSYGGGNDPMMTTWTSSGNSSSIQNQVITPTAAKATIDNSAYSYRIVVDLNPSSDANASTDANHRIYGLRIKYLK